MNFEMLAIKAAAFFILFMLVYGIRRLIYLHRNKITNT